MIGFYNYTVVLTYIGTMFGFLGLQYIILGQLKQALLCLMAAGFCDMFDGKIASTRKRTRQEKRFGIQIDSLSDLVCFGVLPAQIGIHSSGNKKAAIVISIAYLLCALIRLAWFNVDEEERQTHSKEPREYYLGLPVTASALILPLFIGCGGLLYMSFSEATHWLLLLISIGFVTPFRFRKPRGTGILLLGIIGLTALVSVLLGVGR